MKILVLGASGRTGQKFVHHARNQHEVLAFGRRKAPGVSLSKVGVFGDECFAEMVQASDAVVSCLASTNSEPVCSKATKALLAEKPGVRYVTIAEAAVDHPQDRKGVPDIIAGGIMRLIVGGMLADRQKELEMLMQSQPAWTVLRPPRLVNGRATGAWQTTSDRPATTWIDRDDLARALLEMVESSTHLGTAPFVSTATGEKS